MPPQFRPSFRGFSALSVLLYVACAACAACGFQLRGAYSLPYESLYFATGDGSTVGAGLKRLIRASGHTRLVDEAKDAQAIFVPTEEVRQPVILSLSSAGRVREKRLYYRYAYRITDSKGRELMAPGIVVLNRDLSYADSDVLAKMQEEELLWRDMENDLVQQLMRRLATAKPVFPKDEE